MPRIISIEVRAFQLAYTLARFLLLWFLVPGPSHCHRPIYFRHILESLGKNWVKLGQALALRFDLLPPEFCRELLSIHRETDPLPYRAVQDIMKHEYGRSPEQIFLSFDESPFAITSTGQFHRATSEKHGCLAVKLQDPSIERRFAVDLRIMRFFAVIVDWFYAFEMRTASEFVDIFARNVRLEMSFQMTAQNAKLMAKFAADDRKEVNAKVCVQYAGRRVLASEFIEGVTVLRILQAVRASDVAFMQTLRERGLDLNIVAQNIYWNALNQILRDGIFHTDLSPAGLLVVPGNVIAYVDFAVVARVSEEVQASLSYYLQCTIDERFEDAADELMRWLTPSSSSDLGQLRREIVSLLEDYVDGFRSPTQSAPRKQAHRNIVNLMSTMRRHKVIVSSDLLACLTAMLTTESVLMDLAPGFNVLAEQRAFLARAANIDIIDALNWACSQENILTQYTHARNLVRNLGSVLKSGQSISMSLQKLRLRLLQYGVLAVFFSAATYISYRDETLHQVEAMLGIGPYWVSSLLLTFALILIINMGRQARRLNAMDRTMVTERDVSYRSFGRVR